MKQLRNALQVFVGNVSNGLPKKLFLIPMYLVSGSVMECKKDMTMLALEKKILKSLSILPNGLKAMKQTLDKKVNMCMHLQQHERIIRKAMPLLLSNYVYTIS